VIHKDGEEEIGVLKKVKTTGASKESFSEL